MKIYFVVDFEAQDAESAVVSCFDTLESAEQELERLENEKDYFAGGIAECELNKPLEL